MARIRVTRQLGGLQARVSQMTERGQYAVVNQAHADMNNYVPMLSSDLRVQSQVTADGKSVIWNAPYARRHFYNQMVNYTTPGTGPRWDLKAKSIHLDSWRRVAEAAMR